MRYKIISLLAASFSLGIVQAASAADMPVKAPAAIATSALTPSGYIELYGGGDQFNFFDYETNRAWTIGGAGRANWWLTPNFSLQLDAQGEGSQVNWSGCSSSSGCDASAHNYLIAAHGMWRNSMYGIGAFGVLGDASGAYGGSTTFSGFRFGAVGAEGLVNWNMVTLYGQGGYGSTIGSNGSIGVDGSTWWVRGTGRYYPTMNWLLEGTVQGNWTTISPFGSSTSIDVDSVLWRVKAETMVAPWLSLYAAYQGSRSEYPTSFCGSGHTDFTDQRVTVGLRGWINRMDLRSNDITGAPLDVINPFPLFAGGEFCR